jgi:hypothetical protein
VCISQADGRVRRKKSEKNIEGVRKKGAAASGERREL